MSRLTILRSLLVTIPAVELATVAHGEPGECVPEWLPGKGFAGVDNSVFALLPWDPDGGGPLPETLIAAGWFEFAGAIKADGIAAWDGRSWSSMNPPDECCSGAEMLLGFSVDGDPRVIAVGGMLNPDGGRGTTVTSWDGTSWSRLGDVLEGTVEAITVFDDGGGPTLVVGGYFSSIYGTVMPSVAKWTGQSWTPLGDGPGPEVWALQVFDDGTGSALYAAGYFPESGTTPYHSVAKWDGHTWLPVGPNPLLVTSALAVFDDGTGPALYSGGEVSYLGQDSLPDNYLFKWDGVQWTAVGSGFEYGSCFESLSVHLVEGRTELYAAGFFVAAGGSSTHSLVKWDGDSWSTVGGPGVRYVETFAFLNEGGGSKLYVAGGFDETTQAPERGVARWDGYEWATLGRGTDGDIFSVLAGPTASPSVLYVGGEFHQIEGVPARHVAAWDGRRWNALGEGPGGPVDKLEMYDAGSGPSLIAGGWFPYAADGSTAYHIARWNGLDWTALGEGIDDLAGVYAMKEFDDGNGPVLFVSGVFETPGGSQVYKVARWDGRQWILAGTNTLLPVYALEVFDDGSGPALYAGGAFPNLWRLNAGFWEVVPGLLVVDSPNDTPSIWSLVAWEDEGAPALLVGGRFDRIGGLRASGVAKWQGGLWYAMDRVNPCVGYSGIIDAGSVVDFYPACGRPTEYDDGSGSSIVVNRTVVSDGKVVSARLSRYRCLCPHCDADGSGHVDAIDFRMFSACLAGPESPFAPGCEKARLDAGQDVDLEDFAVLQRSFGPVQ